jgi:hypothetical protein
MPSRRAVGLDNSLKHRDTLCALGCQGDESALNGWETGVR